MVKANFMEEEIFQLSRERALEPPQVDKGRGKEFGSLPRHLGNLWKNRS